MDMMKMMKDAMAMKSKLGQMEKALKEKIIDIEQNGVTIKINAKSEIIDLKISPELMKQETAKVEKTILSALQAATKKAQSVMMQEAKNLTGGINIPGLMG